VDELDETAALAGRNLDISNLTEALEERSEFVLGHVARKSANEDSGVVGVGELVHLSSRVECATTAIGRGEGTGPHVLLRNVVHHGRGSMVTGEAVGSREIVSLAIRRASRMVMLETYRFLGVAVEIRMGRLPQ
jgi:hypothetical protein